MERPSSSQFSSTHYNFLVKSYYSSTGISSPCLLACECARIVDDDDDEENKNIERNLITCGLLFLRNSLFVPFFFSFKIE